MSSAPSRKLLVIAGVFPPAGGGGSLRMVKLLTQLPQYGWEPHVIAPRGRSGWFADPGLLDEVATIRTTRVGWSRGGRAMEGLRRRAKDPMREPDWLSTVAAWGGQLRDKIAIPDEQLLWAVAAARCALRLTRKQHFDLLMTASFPYSCHLAGLAVNRRRGIRWLADFADLWVGQPFRGQDRGLRRHVDLFMERAVFNKADAITVVSPGMQRILDERCPEIHDKVFQIQNTYDTAEFAGDVTPPERRMVEILFVGTFDSRVTPPHPFVRGLRRVLHDRPQAKERLRLRVLGGADLVSSRYIRDALGSASGMMSFEGWATHAEVIHEMQRADVLAISVADGAHWHLTAKIFEYLASRRPILAVVPEGDCRQLLRRCGGARVIEPGDEEAMVEALLEAVDTGGIEPDTPRNAEEVARLAATEVARDAALLMDRIVSGRS